jgi:hypothetical protein
MKGLWALIVIPFILYLSVRIFGNKGLTPIIVSGLSIPIIMWLIKREGGIYTMVFNRLCCSECKQSSSLKDNLSDWKIMGKIDGCPFIKCMKCGTGIVLGMLSNRTIPKDKVVQIEEKYVK